MKNVILTPNFFSDILIPDTSSGIILLYIVNSAGGNNEITTSLRKIESDISMTIKSIRNSLKKLEKKGLISCKKTHGKYGGTTVTINDISNYITYTGHINGHIKGTLESAPALVLKGVVESKGHIKGHIKTEKTDEISWIKLQQTWNELIPERRIIKFSNARKKSVTARIRQSSKSDFKKMMDKFSQSDFLTGRIVSENEIHKNFKADFDWAIKESNYIKIIEGKYDNPKTEQQQKVYRKPIQTEFI